MGAANLRGEFCLRTTRFLRRRLQNILVVGTGLLLPGCDDLAAEEVAAGGKQPLVIGHAGSGFLTPLNPFNPLPPSSRASIRQALARGADGVEVDVQLSQDSVLLLYHDEKLIFSRDAKGKATKVEAASVVFERRPIDGEDGKTFQIRPERPVDELRREAAKASPPKPRGELNAPRPEPSLLFRT